MTPMKKVLDEGRCLYRDNWYSSMELLDEQRKRSTHVICTVRMPLVIDTCNNRMGGVDPSDQIMSSYTLEGKRLKKWSKNVVASGQYMCLQ